ncbi:hypothetical protein EST38_g13859, partial [Candolleomyces aberdarensis]
MADGDLVRLELLNLVAKITQEINNYIGFNDKTLAEFVISLHEQSNADLPTFKQKLKDMEAGFPDSFVENVDRLILTMHPKHKKKARSSDNVGDAAPATVPDAERKRRMFPGLAIQNKEQQDPVSDDLFLKELGDIVSGRKKPADTDRLSPKQRRRSPSPKRGRRDDGRPRREIDERPVLFKIYNGKVSGIKDFGAFVTLEGVAGRVEGMVHVSNIQGGARPNSAQDLLSKGQSVKVKVMSAAGTRIGLSMKDVDQITGRNLTPHLRIKSEAELEEDRRKAARAADAAMPLPSDQLEVDPAKYSSSELEEALHNLTLQAEIIKVREDEPSVLAGQTTKRLTSPERWELKQLISSGLLDPADYPELEEDLHNPSVQVKIKEELDIEIREDEPSFLAGQTKRTLDLSPVKIVKAPDGSLNRAALASAALAKERRELRQQEANEENDSQARDFSQPGLDSMSKDSDEVSVQGLRGNVPSRKASAVPIQDQRRSLPIYKLRGPLLKAIDEHQVLIVVGDTGSGKTTQMVQYLAESGYADNGRIGCTQTRRVAATLVAKRVSEEVGCRLGQEVGYTIRFEDCTSPETRIKYMTDGMLRQECFIDPLCSQYSVIILDDAHERTVATDVLFGLLKKAIKRRPDLRLIVTSATLDAEKFSKYFFGCPIFTIPGRAYPVETMYVKEPESDYLDASLITVMQIHLSEPPGDVLLFLTGQEEIDTACEILFERMKALGPKVPDLLILPIYSALPSGVQSRVFEPT